jgi:hypothetical protein
MARCSPHQNCQPELLSISAYSSPVVTPILPAHTLSAPPRVHSLGDTPPKLQTQSSLLIVFYLAFRSVIWQATEGRFLFLT